MLTIRFCAAPDEVAADGAALAGDAAADEALADAATDAVEDTAGVDPVARDAAGVEPVARCVEEVQPAARVTVRPTTSVVLVMRSRALALIDTKRSVGDDDCGTAQQQMTGIVEPNTEPAARNVDDVLTAVVTVERGHRGDDRTGAAAT